MEQSHLINVAALVVAAHAPNKIPIWFKHVPPEELKVKRPYWTDLTDQGDRDLCQRWLSDGEWDLPEHLQWFQKQHNEFYDAKIEWEARNAQERYFQWRAFFAKNIIDRGI